MASVNLPPVPASDACLDFLKTIYGLFDIEAISRYLVRTVPGLVRACGVQVSLRVPGRPDQCWSAGS